MIDKDELRERLMILKQELEKGKLKFAAGLDIVKSLKKVRYGTDGKVAPETVDSSVGYLANVVAFLRRREEFKTVSLVDVQRAYFEILDQCFGHAFVEMSKHDASPHLVASDMAAQPKMVRAFKADAPALAARIRGFWDDWAPIVRTHLEDMRVLKAVFGGDIFPSYTANIACSAGLYVDSIVLPDPFLRVSTLFGAIDPKDAFYYLVKHALNALQYRELALAEVDPPIVVIAPDYSILDEHALDYLQAVGKSDLLAHCGKIFGRHFEDEKQLDEFLTRMQDIDDMVNSTVDPSRLLFDTEWKGDTMADQLKHYLEDIQVRLVPELRPRLIGPTVKTAMFGRMMQTNDVLFTSQEYSGLPLIDAPTSWQYFLWKYEYDHERSTAVNPELRSIFVTHALHAGSSPELDLLARVPPSALIDLRKRGAMAQLRRLLSNGLEEISVADERSFGQVVENVGANIGNAFEEHRKNLADLAVGRRKFFGFDIGSWIVAGAISIAAASTGNIPLTILAASLGMLGAPSAKELWADGKKLLETGRQIRRSPVGILFRVK